MNPISPGKISKKLLSKAVDAEDTPTPTPQSERMQSVAIAATELDTREEYVREIGRLWSQAQERFIEIGNYLIFAKRKLTKHGEYERMISEELPFQRSVAHALKAVAEAVRDGRLHKQELPNSYSTAYLLVTLDDTGIQEAREMGLVKREVRRAQVAEFCRQYRQRDMAPTPEHTRLMKERDVLLAQRRRIDERLGQIERSLQRTSAGGKGRGTVIEGRATEVVSR